MRQQTSTVHMRVVRRRLLVFHSEVFETRKMALVIVKFVEALNLSNSSGERMV
jgi:hypothetical protein